MVWLNRADSNRQIPLPFGKTSQRNCVSQTGLKTLHALSLNCAAARKGPLSTSVTQSPLLFGRSLSSAHSVLDTNTSNIKYANVPELRSKNFSVPYEHHKYLKLHSAHSLKNAPFTMPVSYYLQFPFYSMGRNRCFILNIYLAELAFKVSNCFIHLCGRLILLTYYEKNCW